MNRFWWIGLAVLLLASVVVAQGARGWGMSGDGRTGEPWVHYYLKMYELKPGESFSGEYVLNGTIKAFRVSLKEIVPPPQECLEHYYEWFNDADFCWALALARLSIESTDGSNYTMWGPNGVEAILAREENFPAQDNSEKHVISVVNIFPNKAVVTFFKVAPNDWQSTIKPGEETPLYGSRPFWMPHARMTLEDLKQLSRKNATSNNSEASVTQTTPPVSTQNTSVETTPVSTQNPATPPETKITSTTPTKNQQTMQKTESQKTTNTPTKSTVTLQPMQAKQLLETKEKIACNNFSLTSENNQPVFECKTIQTGKLFGLIPIEFEVHATMDTEKSETKVEKPFWSFLVFR